MQLAIFDVDGTLTRTNRVDEACFVRAFADELGITAINTNWSDYIYSTDSGIALQVFQERLGRPPSADELSRLQRRFVRLLEESFTQNPQFFTEIAGASTALRRLKREADWAVAIATGGWQASALLKLKKAPFDIEGVPAAFADDGISRDDIVRMALSKARDLHGQESFRRVVYIGDAAWDVHTAIRLSLAFLGVGGDRREAALRNEGAAHIIRDFTDFDRFFQTLEEARVPICLLKGLYP